MLESFFISMWNPMFIKDLNLKPNIHEISDLKLIICKYKIQTKNEVWQYPQKNIPGKRIFPRIWKVNFRETKNLRSQYRPHPKNPLSAKSSGISPFQSSVAFYNKPIVWFTKQIKWLVSISEATLGRNGLKYFIFSSQN